MDIAALSTIQSHVQVQQNVNTELAKKAMDVSETQSDGLMKMMDASSTPPHPTSGKSVDVSV